MSGPITIDNLGGVPLVVWGSENIDQNTYDQAAKTARLPFMHDHVALMPDAHFGYGSTVGSVLATRGAVVPSFVGVDIGCGMNAARLDVTAEQLVGKENPTDAEVAEVLAPLHPRLVRAIPAGMGEGHLSGQAGEEWVAQQAHRPPLLDDGRLKHPLAVTAHEQFGSLGGGNHFVEVCLDAWGHVWVMLHSGSRGVGNKLANHHIDAAKGRMADLIEQGVLEDPDLAYLVEGTPEFDAYIADMLWAQDYAAASRERMMFLALREIDMFIAERGFPVMTVTEQVNCHHNFAVRERHDGIELWVTRKGAVRARAGDRGIIPGSMATGSYITTGLGNPRSFMSSSHGAGRTMGRKAAKRTFTVEDMRAAMAGKVWNDREASQLIDEIPNAYKPIEEVMAAQDDLVAVTDRLRQIVNMKGTS